MDAETTWRVWRKVLRDEQLSERVVNGSSSLSGLGLTAEESEVVAAYAARPKGSRWAIETYRYRLVSAALHALATGGALTGRLLLRANVDLRELAREFVESRGYADDGPFVYHTCSAFLGYIRESAILRHLPGLPDITSLDLAASSLMMQCARLPSDLLVSGEESRRLPAEPASAWYVQTGLGVMATMSRRVTPWLTNADLFARSELEERPEHLLVYLPGPDRQHELSLIGDEAAALFLRVAAPCSYTALVNHLALDASTSEPRDDEVVGALSRFVAMGVVRGAATEEEALAISQFRRPA